MGCYFTFALIVVGDFDLDFVLRPGLPLVLSHDDVVPRRRHLSTGVTATDTADDLFGLHSHQAGGVSELWQDLLEALAVFPDADGLRCDDVD